MRLDWADHLGHDGPWGHGGPLKRACPRVLPVTSPWSFPPHLLWADPLIPSPSLTLHPAARSPSPCCPPLPLAFSVRSTDHQTSRDSGYRRQRTYHTAEHTALYHWALTTHSPHLPYPTLRASRSSQQSVSCSQHHPFSTLSRHQSHSFTSLLQSLSSPTSLPQQAGAVESHVHHDARSQLRSTTEHRRLRATDLT